MGGKYLSSALGSLPEALEFEASEQYLSCTQTGFIHDASYQVVLLCTLCTLFLPASCILLLYVELSLRPLCTVCTSCLVLWTPASIDLVLSACSCAAVISASQPSVGPAFFIHW